MNNYMALSRKVQDPRARKQIAQEIHDTGHALTGISAGLDAVRS